MNIESGSLLDQIFLSSLFLFGLLILLGRHFEWSSAISKNVCLILLLSYMLVSTLWSDIPFISVKRWIRELIAVVMAFVILSERNPREAMESLFRRSIYILIPFSLILIKYFPKYGREYSQWEGKEMWIGVTMQKNGLGRLCLIAAFYLIWTLLRRWQGKDIPVNKYQTYSELFILGSTFLLLWGPAGAYSATAIASLTLGVTAFMGLLWMKKKQIHLAAITLMVILAFIMCVGILMPMVGGSPVSSLTSLLGRDESLTGRTDIWAELLPFVQRHPIWGCGFGGFWTTGTTELLAVNETHNGYLEVLLHLGIIGITFTAIFLLFCCRQAQKELDRDYDWGSLCVCFILMAAIHNISESSFDSFDRQLTAVLLFLSVLSTSNKTCTLGISQEVRYQGPYRPNAVEKQPDAMFSQYI